MAKRPKGMCGYCFLSQLLKVAEANKREVRIESLPTSTSVYYASRPDFFRGDKYGPVYTEMKLVECFDRLPFECECRLSAQHNEEFTRLFKVTV